jgi:polyisoprenoid-binding protein YceI
MNIKGITREISIPLTFDKTNPNIIIAKGSVDLDRTLWDIKYGSDKFFKGLGDNIIDDMFNISFEIKLNTNK